MIIKFTNYSDGIHEFELVKKAKDLHLEEPFINDVHINCKMDKSHSQLVLSCDLSVDVKLTCDRCADDFESKFENHFDNIYLFGREEEPLEDIDVYQLAPEADKIDLSEDVKEYANLALPMKILCSEDCLGLCPKCGKNLNEQTCGCSKDNVSNVWEPLQKLKDKLNK
ncbi:MAG: hypothetical protein CVV23_06785 [Ignavibacteriae bacterium HGW-Ignavibacteriae-2]|jgi:uncharacterized protein|nr:DUF177 domain-containing protein [Bacteroidota bacterium]PKL89112.1 MAG: hypothetical protein CVV23_06785 [Ignavibacteriae bacterium HGW-Ignavibacteriae-2]